MPWTYKSAPGWWHILDGQQVIGKVWTEERAKQIVAGHNTHATLLAACKAVEWSGEAFPQATDYQGCASDCCPLCGGIKPRHPDFYSGYDWDKEAYGHRNDCTLKAAIDAAESKEP
jgi:hypothetical protein